MLPRNHPDRIDVAFDDRRLVNNAGLILPATLALHLGLPELVDRRLDLGDAPGRGTANTGDKIMTLNQSQRWDVHLPGAGNRGGSLAGVFRPLIAGPSGSAVSPHLSGWTARPGICRHAPAPPPCCPSTDCQ